MSFFLPFVPALFNKNIILYQINHLATFVKNQLNINVRFVVFLYFNFARFIFPNILLVFSQEFILTL